MTIEWEYDTDDMGLAFVDGIRANQSEIAWLMRDILYHYDKDKRMDDLWLENLEQIIIAYFQEKDNEHRESE